MGGRLCGYVGWFPESGQNMGALKYFAQLYTTKRFQEPQTVDDWVRGKLSPLVDLGKIDRVPVSLIVMLEDTTCPPHQAEFLYDQIGAPGKRINIEGGSHTTTFWWNAPVAIDRIVDTIEQGSPEEYLSNAARSNTAR